MAALAFAAGLTALTAWLTSDRDEFAAEVEERSQAPTVQHAHLVDDGLEVAVAGHPEAAHCLEAPAELIDLVPQAQQCTHAGATSVVVPLEEVTDPVTLVDEEVIVVGRSAIQPPQLDGSPLEIESEPSAPAPIVDAR